MSESPKLVCVGNLTVDEAVSPRGERVESIGGDALFAALGATVVRGNPTILAPLGTDAPVALLGALRVAGTDPESLPLRDLPMVRNVIRYDDAGGRVWDLVLGEEHFEALSVHPTDVSDDVLSASGVLLSAMALHAQLDLAAWLRTRTAATIYFDPQEDYLAGHVADVLDAVAACDVFLPSEVEAAALAQTADLHAAAATFLALGPQAVVIKLADAGCLVASSVDPEPVLIAADVIEPVDSTGAGDAFCGAFAAEHLRSGDVHAAARAGAGVARIAISGPGVSALLTAVTSVGGVPR
ncbi:carbohydrate kinase family protein [Mycolicibacterium hodleri]|uniref:Carbohydrate kinase family protein n=1 Tax=Mycolicibacterium hodleri TaxID=49897 RepID=A0A502EJA9_9MYCO|nr:carbohydrate kinase family protein [Mycolicibacterium hodleri]TPG37139.1 carbohydrate kinase family protein [Mycolicibacterium hodleri]